MTFNLDFSQGAYSDMATPVSALGFPETFGLRDAEPLLRALPEGDVLLGINGEGNPTTVNLDTDSPHILVSAGTGGGKSVTTRAILSTAVARGAVGVVLDVKRHSHKWAYECPERIGYARTITEIGTALVELGKEVHRRNAIIEHHDGPECTAPVGPRMVIAFEEINATMSQLRDLDKRSQRGYTASQALQDVLLLGRAAKVHMIGVMQFPDYRVLNQAMIEQFNVRVMLRYTKNMWTKIAWDAGLPQSAPSEVGRGMVVYGGKARETQITYITSEEATRLVQPRLALPYIGSPKSLG